MNLINLIQSQLSPQTIGQIGNTLGESPDQTRSALGTAIPALLGTLVGKATSSSVGANDVFNLVKQNQGSWSDSASNWLSGATSGGAPSSNSLLTSLLGSKFNGVADFIASHTGIKGSSAGAILGMAAPLIMGILGKQISSQGLGASGLGQLLAAQVPFLKDLIPAGLAQTLGLTNVLSGVAEAPKVETPLHRASERETSYQQKYGQMPEREPVPAGQPRKGSALKWAVPLLLLALGSWFLFSRGGRNRDVGGSVDYSQTQVGRDAALPRASVSITPGSIADNLTRAAANGDYTRSISLQGIGFDATGNITEAARGKVQEISTVMSASPGMKIKITCYGVSEDEGLTRANAIKTALMATGVTGDRIQAAGEMGSGGPTLNVMP